MKFEMEFGWIGSEKITVETHDFEKIQVIQEFIKAGAPEEIAYVAKPHIGTFRLVGVVEKMRQEIISLGGEVRFQQKVTGFEIKDG